MIKLRALRWGDGPAPGGGHNVMIQSLWEGSRRAGVRETDEIVGAETGVIRPLVQERGHLSGLEAAHGHSLEPPGGHSSAGTLMGAPWAHSDF